MPAFLPVIDPEIHALRPDFRAFSLLAENVANPARSEGSDAALARACAEPCAEPWAAAHREAWQAAYRAFGAKPQRTPCSAEALLKRVQRDGTLPAINAVVDLYNAVSLRYAIPVGGENVEAYRGTPRLVRADGSEAFETVQSGSPVLESPDAGEVVWRDELGVTCRRWNWRQGARTRIETTTTRMWFVLEALDPMPEAALLQAGRELALELRALSPSCTLSASLLTRAGASRLSPDALATAF